MEGEALGVFCAYAGELAKLFDEAGHGFCEARHLFSWGWVGGLVRARGLGADCSGIEFIGFGLGRGWIEKVVLRRIGEAFGWGGASIIY